MRPVVNLVSNIILHSEITVQYDGFIGTASDYINNNLDKNLCVKSLCEKLYVSKKRLYGAFKSQYGTTVNDYIWECRLNAAKETLPATSRCSYDIALKIGIENYAHFCKTFKMKEEMTPVKYRKLNSAFLKMIHGVRK